MKTQRKAKAGELTRQHIMDVAEQLFSELGPDGVSVRTIANSAEVNLAAVNYHFGSKERLLEDIFARRVIPVNKRRLELLDRAIARAEEGSSPSLTSVLDAFVRPPMEFAFERDGSARSIVVMQFLNHAISSEGETDFLEEYYGLVRTRFTSALVDVLPDLDLEEVVWRYNFLVGSIIYAMGGSTRMTRIPKGLEQPRKSAGYGSETAIKQLLTVAEASFRAPSAKP